MKKKNDPQRLEELLEQHLKQSPVTFNFETWASEYPQEAERLRSGGVKSTRLTPILTLKSWRHIMTSPITRIAAVVITGFVLSLFLFPSNHSLFPGSIALADVQAAVKAQESVCATGTRSLTWQRKPKLFPPAFAHLFNTTDNNEGPFHMTMTSRTWLTPEGLACQMSDSNNTRVASIVIGLEAKEVIILFPTVKLYVKFKIPEAYHSRLSGLTLQGMMGMMILSQGTLIDENRQIDGIDAIGFEITNLLDRYLGEFNPTFLRFLINIDQAQSTACVWVDPETKLPVRSEGTFHTGGCVLTFFEQAKMSFVGEGFEWDIENGEQGIYPGIPSG